MGTILEDIDTAADWISEALQSSGYGADFSAASVRELDRFFDEHANGGEPVSGGLLSEDLGPRVFAIGAYLGEVLRRHLGGEWRGDGDDPEAEISIALHLSDGSVCWPVQRVMKRFKNGAEDNLTLYAHAFGVSDGQPPEGPTVISLRKKPWWKLW